VRGREAKKCVKLSNGPIEESHFVTEPDFSKNKNFFKGKSPIFARIFRKISNFEK
jgi:hypothetical protein